MRITENEMAKTRHKLELLKHKWALIDDGEILVTHSSLLQPVIYDGIKSMLKVPLCAEERRSSALMVCWDGNAAAKVLKHSDDALLMERAVGTESLRKMVLNGKEDEANKIICAVAAKLHKANCRELTELIPLKTWFVGLGHAALKHGGVFRLCAEIADRLLNNPQDIVALHGDIHYDNILDCGIGEWIAIDPKALIGERGFDFANLFCNPTPEIATSVARLREQTKLIAAEAGLDTKRLLQWIAAWSGLSAAWAIEDGEDTKVQITVAENALTELAGAVSNIIDIGLN
jgi:streptomycin 6-kinase